jgi:hypothetical protein
MVELHCEWAPRVYLRPLLPQNLSHDVPHFRLGFLAQRRSGRAELLAGDGLKGADLARLAGQRLDHMCLAGLDHHEGQAVVEGLAHRLGLPTPARPGCAVRAGVVRRRWASRRAAKVEGARSVIRLYPRVDLHIH